MILINGHNFCWLFEKRTKIILADGRKLFFSAHGLFEASVHGFFHEMTCMGGGLNVARCGPSHTLVWPKTHISIAVATLF
jgi:hypothetical protein